MWAFLFTLGACHRNDPDTLYARASQELDEGKPYIAEETVDKLLQSSAAQNPIWHYKFIVLKAEAVVTDHPDEALRLLQPEPPSQLAATEIPALRKLTQGKAYFFKGNSEDADVCVKEARAVASAGSPRVLSSIAYMQGYMLREHDPVRAEQYFREAYNSAREYKEKLTETGALINLSLILMKQEQYDEAITELSLALELSRAAPTDPRGEEVALGNLGWSYYQLGDFDHATSLLKAANANATQTGRKDGQQRWSIDLGDVYLSKKEYAQAEKYFRMGQIIAASNKDWHWNAFALHDLALLELSRNDVSKAEEYNQQLMEVAKRAADPYVDSVCTVTTAELAMRHNQFSNAGKLLLSVVANIKDSSLLQRAQTDLARVYVAEKKPAKADEEYQAAIHTVESARAVVKQEERRMSILDAWPFYDEYIRFLVDEGKDRKALQIAEHSRSRTLVEGLKTHENNEPEETVPELSIPAVQSFLRRQGKVILAYWLADEESYLWVVTPSNVEIRRLRPKREIEQEVQVYSAKLLRHAGLDDSTNGEKLYELLVRPSDKFIPKGSQVIIIPHRSLYKLNFESLVVPGPRPHYWIDDVTAETAGSMVLLASSRQKQSAVSLNLLLIGAPVQASNDFEVLDHAADEMQKVAAHFDSEHEKVISKEEATPSAFTSNQPDKYAYIHFVTHGIASETSPLDSAIILSPQAEHVFKLYARDIVGLKLSADVVTISACYGAGKKASGEGLVGLAWAFLRAGAHQVVAGLWEVDDRATPDLMDNFYTGLKTQNAASALRAAKLKMVHSEGAYHLPYYWGSLQLYTGS